MNHLFAAALGAGQAESSKVHGLRAAGGAKKNWSGLSFLSEKSTWATYSNFYSNAFYRRKTNRRRRGSFALFIRRLSFDYLTRALLYSICYDGIFVKYVPALTDVFERGQTGRDFGGGVNHKSIEHVKSAVDL